MRSGGSHSKGATYERNVCRQLSLWVSGGAFADGFWRSAMSGGRATVRARKGEFIQQVGDLTAVRPECAEFTRAHFVECKHYRNLALEAFFLEGKGVLAGFWLTVCKEAKRHKRTPLLIARQNRTADLIIARPGVVLSLCTPKGTVLRVRSKRLGNCEVRLLTDVLAAPFIGG